MKKILSLAVMSVALLPVSLADVAHARPDVTRMSCSQAKSLIDRSGAIVVSTGTYTYARYVRSQRYCDRSERIRRQTVRTRDSNSCFIGYICVDVRNSPGR